MTDATLSMSAENVKINFAEFCIEYTDSGHKMCQTAISALLYGRDSATSSVIYYVSLSHILRFSNNGFFIKLLCSQAENYTFYFSKELSPQLQNRQHSYKAASLK